MREYNAVFSAPGFVGIVPDFFLYLRHEYATNMPRICKDLPSTQTSAFILADTSRDVITECTIPQIMFFWGGQT